MNILDEQNPGLGFHSSSAKDFTSYKLWQRQEATFVCQRGGGCSWPQKIIILLLSVAEVDLVCHDRI